MPAHAQTPADRGREPAAPPVFGLVTRQAEQSAADPYEFVMSTDDTDRMGDVVDVGGIDLRAFRKNPVALWNHNPDSPIGTWADLRREGGKLIGKLTLAADRTSPLIDRLRQLIEQRILRAVSIGFRALVVEPMADGMGLRFLKSELVECSLVSIPANAAALRVRSMAPHPADPEIFRREGAPGSNTRTRAATAPPPRRQLASAGVKPMPKTIAERITALQTRSATIDAELTAIQDAAAEAEDREFTADETDAIEALTAEKAAVVRNLTTLQTLESTLAAKAQPVGGGNPAIARVPALAARQEKPGFMLAKIALVSAAAHVTKQPPQNIIAQRYADDDRVAACFDYVKRTSTNIADTTTPGWAAELVREDVAAFMADLENVSVFAALRARGRAVDLDGVGSITIPNRTNRGNMAGAWVGEAGVIPVVQGTFGSQKLEPTKLAAITAFTKELLNHGNSQVEAILRDALRIDTADLLDRALLDNSPAVGGIRPAGLANGANTAASGGPADVSADLLAAIAPILAAGSTGAGIVLVMNPAQKLALSLAENLMGLPAYPSVGASGTLANYPIIASNNVPAGTVFVIDAAEFASGAGVPDFDVSEEATLTMANADGTAPTQAIDFTGAIATAGHVAPDAGIKVAGGAAGAGTAGVVAMSMFQQWSVALRMILPAHWKMLREDMVSTITGVDWGGAAAP